MQQRMFSMDDLFSIIVEQKWKILLFILLGIFVGYFISDNIQENYEASTEILISYNKADNNNASNTLLQTYKEIIGSTVLLESINARIEEPITQSDYDKMVTFKSNENSQLMTIIASHQDEQMAINLVDAIAASYKQQMAKLTTQYDVSVLQKGKVISGEAGVYRNIFISLIGGLVSLAIVLIYFIFLEVYRPRLNNELKANELDLDVIAEIPNTTFMLSGKKRQSVIDHTCFYSSILFQRLFTNGSAPIMLISHQDNAGKASYVNMLAKQIASEKKRILYIQFNDISTVSAKNWKMYEQQALPLSELTTQTNYRYYDELVLPTNESFYAEQHDQVWQQLLQDAKLQYEVVICEAEMNGHAIAMTMGQYIQNAIYMVNTKKTTMQQVKHDMNRLKRLNLQVVGTVLNK